MTDTKQGIETIEKLTASNVANRARAYRARARQWEMAWAEVRYRIRCAVEEGGYEIGFALDIMDEEHPDASK